MIQKRVTPGPIPLASIARRRVDLGADCMNCAWKLYAKANGPDREARLAAMAHARQEGHVVLFETEETTRYEGAPIP